MTPPDPTSEHFASELAPLYSPRTVHDLLARYGLRPTKSLGQNFLIDGNTLRLIAETGGAEPGANILEVGPGLGVLTHELARRGAQVTTLEKDERLRGVLGETLQEPLLRGQIRIVWGDALEYDYAALPAGTRVVANLPYYISTALLTRFMQSPNIVSATVLVQREVAQRLSAQPGQDGYGFLSAMVSLHGTARLVRDVAKGAFFPPPDVTSSIVRLDFDGRKPSRDLVHFLEVALHHRRKTLRNNLRLVGYDAQAIDHALVTCGLSPNVRAEDIALSDMQRLSELLGREATS